jgi:hypothetical protein
VTWSDALAYCAALPGGFRLPSIKEIQTIVNYSVPSPGLTLYTSAFPTPASALYFWTSSPISGVPTSAWLMNFMTGISSWNGQNAQYYARCVRTP